MKIIEGFESVKSILSRQASGEESDTDEKEQVVRQIVNDVRERGDAALFDYTEKFDGVRLTSLEIGKEPVERAHRQVDAELLSALELAAERIRTFHQAQKDGIWHEVSEAGLSQLMRPLQRVGVHAPGFTAPLPSSLLMTAIPAKVAGVKEIIMVTPPRPQGGVSTVTLAAATIAGVDRVFCVGGAQAIAALAYGTESIPSVDKICGPGNIYVTLAKKQVFGIVGIDGFYGPSEVLIIADEKASPEYCAAELLAQAEHDPLAGAIMVTTSRRLADEVNREVEQQLSGISHQSVAGESLDKGIIAVVASLDEAIELANLYAPEHLCLMVEDAASHIGKVTNAGCIVAGREATVALGDYVAGPSHVLPTGGTGRFGSPLNICDFIKFMSIINTDELDIKQLGKAASIIARAEGLDAHAQAVEKRLKQQG